MKKWYDGLANWVYQRWVLLVAIAFVLAATEVVVLSRLFAQRYAAPPMATATPTPTLTGTPTAEPTATDTPLPEPTATDTPFPEPTATATPIVGPTATPTRVVWPTATPTPAIVDWRGEYFDNATLLGRTTLVRNDPSPASHKGIDFFWGFQAPAQELPTDGFSARWTRTLQFGEGIYRFHAVMDDGMRLYIDGEVVIDEWRDGSLREATADLRLSEGQHILRVEYYERTGLALARLWWEKLTAYPDWKGEYWSNRNLEGDPALVRNDPDPISTIGPTPGLGIDFDWGQGSPAEGIPNDSFSARWTRQVGFDGGTYRFHTLVDDGVRLWVDNQPVIDAWYDHSLHELTAEYALVEGQHAVQIEYYDHTGEARIRVWWEEIPFPSYPDWKGEYWSNRDLEGDPALVRNDPGRTPGVSLTPDLGIDFDWQFSAPAHGLPADNFSVRWTRKADFEATTYRFHALVDDGLRLWVGGQRLIDAWYDGDERELTAEHDMVRGTHTLRVEYYEHWGSARIRVWWEKVASPTYPDWKGEYWPNRDLSGAPALTRNDAEIDFQWQSLSPAAGLPADDFSTRWSRQATFEPGMYHLYTWADDGVRVYVDGTLVLNEWHGSRDEIYWTSLSLSGSHRLVVEYFEQAGDAGIRFWWLRIGP